MLDAHHIVRYGVQSHSGDQVAESPPPPPVTAGLCECRIEEVERRPCPEGQSQTPLLRIVRIAQLDVVRGIEAGIQREDDDSCLFEYPSPRLRKEVELQFVGALQAPCDGTQGRRVYRCNEWGRRRHV